MFSAICILLGFCIGSGYERARFKDVHYAGVYKTEEGIHGVFLPGTSQSGKIPLSRSPFCIPVKLCVDIGCNKKIRPIHGKLQLCTCNNTKPSLRCAQRVLDRVSLSGNTLCFVYVMPGDFSHGEIHWKLMLSSTASDTFKILDERVQLKVRRSEIEEYDIERFHAWAKECVAYTESEEQFPILSKPEESVDDMAKRLLRMHLGLKSDKDREDKSLKLADVQCDVCCFQEEGNEH